MAIKAGSPFGKTIVVEPADDQPAYIPTITAFKEGRYETVNSIVESGGGESDDWPVGRDTREIPSRILRK